MIKKSEYGLLNEHCLDSQLAPSAIVLCVERAEHYYKGLGLGIDWDWDAISHLHTHTMRTNASFQAPHNPTTTIISLFVRTPSPRL